MCWSVWPQKPAWASRRTGRLHVNQLPGPLAFSSLRCVENGFDSPEDIARLVRGMVADMHKDSAVAPIRFPGPQGAFPGDILLRPPPVVVDANVLQERHPARLPHRAANRPGHGRERRPSPPVLRRARLREVIEHSGDWTADRAGHPRRLPPQVAAGVPAADPGRPHRGRAPGLARPGRAGARPPSRPARPGSRRRALGRAGPAAGGVLPVRGR